MQSNPIKLWHIAVLFTLVIFTGTPKSISTGCIEEIILAKVINFSYNCDTPSLTHKLADPERFFTEFHNWKGRPVYFSYGYVVGNTLEVLTEVIKPFISVEDHMEEGKAKLVVDALHFYFAYFLLNLFIVFLCCWFAIRLSGFNSRSLPAAALAFAIASLDIVEGGTFLVHTNIMNLVAAIGTAMYFVMASQFHLLSRFSLVLLGLTTGLSILVYPALALFIPGFISGLMFSIFWEDNKVLLNGRNSAYTLATFLSLCTLPLLCWSLANHYIFETRTYLTLDKGQFQWILAAFNKPDVSVHIFSKLIDYLTIIYNSIKFELLLIAGSFLVLILSLRKYKTFKTLLRLDIPLASIATAILGVLLFNFLQGYYAPRMFYSIIALFYIGIMRTAHISKCERPMTYVIATAGLVQLADALLTHTTTGQ